MCVATCIPCQDDLVFFSTGFKVTRWSVSLLLHIVLYVSTLQKSNAQSLSVYSYISVCNTCSEHNIMIHPALHAAAVTYVSMSIESSESFLLWSAMRSVPLFQAWRAVPLVQPWAALNQACPMRCRMMCRRKLCKLPVLNLRFCLCLQLWRKPVQFPLMRLSEFFCREKSLILSNIKY